MADSPSTGAVISTITVVVTPTVTLSRFSTTSGLQPSTTSSLATSSISLSVAPSPSSSTLILPIPTTTPPSTSSTAFPCSSGFRACAANLGGGCCPTDRECGPSSCVPLSTGPISSPTSTDPDFVIPVRPTSNGVATITMVSMPTSANDICPTGFYQCSAYYHGGCCRVGRDCALTSCPTPDSTTVANANGVVILGPVGSETGSVRSALGRGSCAQGWYNCAEEDGGGCCPSGYACGQSCTATAAEATGTVAVQPRIATSGSATSRAWKWEDRMSLVVFAALGLLSGSMKLLFVHR